MVCGLRCSQAWRTACLIRIPSIHPCMLVVRTPSTPRFCVHMRATVHDTSCQMPKQRSTIHDRYIYSSFNTILYRPKCSHIYSSLSFGSPMQTSQKITCYQANFDLLWLWFTNLTCHATNFSLLGFVLLILSIRGLEAMRSTLTCRGFNLLSIIFDPPPILWNRTRS